jgi:hypothetical protein
MPKKWKEILSDKSVPDDFAISVNGETLTIGQMRDYDRENEGALTQRLSARETELSNREKNLNDASIGIATMLERISGATGMSTEDLLQGKMPSKKEVASGAQLDENDPLVGTLVKEIKSLRGEVQSNRTLVDELKKNALGPMLNTYLDDYYESQWEKLHGSIPEGAELSRDKALEYANKSGYKDTKGRLDLSKAIKDLTYDARVKQEAKKLAAEERKQMENEFALRSAPRPSQLGQRIKPDKSVLNEKGQVKSLDEVLNDAVNDADLWRGLSQVQ